MPDHDPPGAGTLSGSALVSAFLSATQSMAERDSADVAGVSQSTYQRWTRQPPRVLRASQRLRIERYLGLETPDPEVWLG